MAIWQKPPRDQYDLFVEYMQTNYGNRPQSIACDSNKLLTHFEMPDMDDTEFAALLLIVQAKFSQIFG